MKLFFYKKPIAVAALIIFCLVTAVIFYFALQTGEQSSGVSRFVSAFLEGIDISHEKLDTDIEKVNIVSLSVSGQKAAYYVGESTTLTVTAAPTNNTEGYKFTSSDGKIAKVSDTGVVTFLSEGIVTITVTGKNGAVSGTTEFEVYTSDQSADGLDLSNLTMEISDSLPANDSKAVSVRYKGKPIALKYTLESSDTSVADTKGSYVLTRGAGDCTLSLKVGEETIISKPLTVTDVTLEDPDVKNCTLGDNEVTDKTVTVYLGHNYDLGFILNNEDAAVKSYIISAATDNVKVAYFSSSSKVTITPKACGINALTIYSRTKLDTPLMTVNVNIVPPPPVVEAIVTPEKGFVVNTAYALKMKFADENSSSGYTYTVEGKDYTKSNGKVTFNKAGEYKVTFSSVYYPTEVYEFTLIVLDPAHEAAVRKQVGHFGMFAVLGVFGLLSLGYFIKKPVYKSIIVTLAGLVVAAASELLQLPAFTKSRGTSITDILIDFGGYALGAAFALIMLFVVYMIISRRRASSPTDE